MGVSSAAMSSVESARGLSGSWYRPRFLAMGFSAAVIALGLLCGIFILFWKAWIVYDSSANAVDFKASLLAYTVTHPNITEEVRESWKDCCTFPMSMNPNKSDLDDVESAGVVAFALIMIAVASGAASLFGALSLAMPPAYKCDFVSARGKCEMITMLVFDLVTFLFGFLGFIIYYAMTNSALDKIVCFDPDPCTGKAEYGDAFAFVFHLLAYCCCSGDSYNGDAYSSEYEYAYVGGDDSGEYEESDDDEYVDESSAYEYEYESS